MHTEEWVYGTWIGSDGLQYSGYMKGDISDEITLCEKGNVPRLIHAKPVKNWVEADGVAEFDELIARDPKYLRLWTREDTLGKTERKFL